jgi:cyclic pyranopterin phosphate synthase
MPPGGVKWKPHNAMLRFEEILRLCGIMAELGIRKFKVTGGEPLVRKGTASFIRGLKAIPGIEQVTITTNGLLLESFLNEAGNTIPDAFNLSLDTLDEERFIRLTHSASEGSGCHTRVQAILSLVDRLLEKNIPVKINCVPVRGFNEEDILPMAALARDKNIAVRFIELMPLGAASAFRPVPAAEILSMLEKQFGSLSPFTGALGNGPAWYYSLRGFTGKIGFISALSHGFCETCNRLRLSAEGVLKPCLSGDAGTDLRGLLRGGASDGEISGAIEKMVSQKPRSHTFSDLYGNVPAEHKTGMYHIGG